MISLTETEEAPKPHRLLCLRPTKDYILGIALLLVVVLLWTSSNFVTQSLFVGGYHKPFLVTYLNTSSFILYLVPFLFRYWWERQNGISNNPQEARSQYEVLSSSEHEISTRTPYVPVDIAGDDATNLVDAVPLTTTDTARLALIFCFLWFIANWSVNSSLAYTSVASSTILSSTSGFFTLAIGRIFYVEYLNAVKIAAVITSFVGLLLVSLSDSSSPNPNVPDPIQTSLIASKTNVYANPLLGDILAILAAVFYALYVILLKVRIRSESRINMQLFFGFVGAFNIIAMFPVGLILHLTGYEPFELPATGNSWGAVLVNMFITLSSDYIYVLAMLKTTPLVVTVGLSLTIPLAIVGDELLNIPTKKQAVLGALLVLGSFGLLSWENAETVPQEKNRSAEPEDQALPAVGTRDEGD